eukprot:Awhi_evm1s10479
MDEPQHYLTQPEIINSLNGFVNATLTVDEGTINGPFGIKFNTRLINDQFPGPSFRVNAGDNVELLLKNHLGPNNQTFEENVQSNYNALHRPNSTNLHLHGMHINSMGIQDNVLLNVEPGEYQPYYYEIQSDHSSGTSYYHPHLHGSTSVQVFGGMAGAFIVNDIVTEKNSKFNQGIDQDLVLIFQGIDLQGGDAAFLKVMDHGGSSNLNVNLQNPNNIDYNILLTNGQYIPKMKMRVEDVIRFRLVNGHYRDSLNIGMTSSSKDHCKLYTIALDGVYLPSSKPRLEERSIFLPSGGRADILVQCDQSGKFELTTVVDETLANYNNIWGPRKFKEEYVPNNVQSLLTLQVEENSESDRKKATNVAFLKLPHLPAYLTKLTDNKFKQERKELDTSFNFYFSNDHGQMVVNNQSFSMDDNLVDLNLDTFYQWRIGSAEPYKGGYPQHPYHQHINHFLMMENDMATNGLLYRQGDLRDTVPLYNSSSPLIQFYPADYTGSLMIHCHNLPHEDKGMMATATIN